MEDYLTSTAFPATWNLADVFRFAWKKKEKTTRKLDVKNEGWETFLSFKSLFATFYFLKPAGREKFC